MCDLQVSEQFFLHTLQVKFCLNVGVKLGNLTTSSMMEIKVVETNDPPK